MTQLSVKTASHEVRTTDALQPCMYDIPAIVLVSIITVEILQIADMPPWKL